MRSFLEYATACVLIIAIGGLIAWMIAPVSGRLAIMTSASLAFVVQLATFGVARVFQRRSVMLGWGLGSALRFLVLVLYAIVLARLWRAPMAPALLSFVTFLFATTVVEPVFLRR